jgi:hypothetical protein
MRISQFGAPSVFLSSNVVLAGTVEEGGYVAVNVPVKIEDRADDDGPLMAQFHPPKATPLEGKAVENRTAPSWLLFKIPRDVCPEGGSLTFYAVVDEAVLWQKEYRVVWNDRFPALTPAPS